MTPIYLSSVTPALARYQNTIYRAIQGLGDYPCVRLDDFTETESESLCRTLDSAGGVFIFILGEQRGRIHKASGKSYAEREYDAAVQAKVPRLVFFAPEEFHEPFVVEPASEREHQQAFRERVRNDPQVMVLDANQLLSPELDHKLGAMTMEAILNSVRGFERFTASVLSPDLRGKTWLLSPYLISRDGWDSGIAISSVSLDPIGKSKPHQGGASAAFLWSKCPHAAIIAVTPIPPPRPLPVSRAT